MKRKAWPVFLATVLAGFALCTRAYAEGDLPLHDMERIEGGLTPAVQVAGRSYQPASITSRMDHYNVPAMSIAVIHEGRLAWMKGYGVADLETGQSVTPDTMFQAASISKAMTATAALKMVQAGKLALDDDVNAKLKSWKVPANAFTAKHPVTLREILMHTAGFTVHGFSGYSHNSPLPSVVQILNGTPPAISPAVQVVSEPGAKFNYSGGGYEVAQLLMSDVSGRPFADLLHDSVFAPLGMIKSTFAQPLPSMYAHHAAAGYSAQVKRVPGGSQVYPELAAAGLWTTPTDIARWIIGIQNALIGVPNSILTPQLAEAMIVPGPNDRGLGVEVKHTSAGLVFQHGGANQGFRAQFVGFVSQGEGVAVMTNSDAGESLAMEFIQSVARTFGWPGFAPTQIVPRVIDPRKLAEFAGNYATGYGTNVVVHVKSDVLYAEIPGGEAWELVPTANDVFQDATYGQTLTFERGKDKKIARISFGYGDAHWDRVP